MKTKSVILTAALLTVLTLSSFVPGAEGRFRRFLERSPETRANFVTAIMKNRLSLDEAQAEKAYQINLKYAKMSQPYMEKEEISPKTRDELILLNMKRKEELITLLTPEQKDEVEVIRKKWIGRLEIILARLKENDKANSSN